MSTPGELFEKSLVYRLIDELYIFAPKDFAFRLNNEEWAQLTEIMKHRYGHVPDRPVIQGIPVVKA